VLRSGSLRQVGNCWLIAAIACLSNYPGAIMRVFLTREATERGLYQVIVDPARFPV
jgi:hypothetical protein